MCWEKGVTKNYLLMVTQFQFYKMKKVIKMDGGDSYITL